MSGTAKSQGKDKFEKMVKISQKLYSSGQFKDKENNVKRKKLLIQLRGLYDRANINDSFEEAVIKCGWIHFHEWCRETMCELKLPSETEHKQLLQMLNNENGVHCTLMKGPNIDQNELKHLLDLTSQLMKDYYDNSQYLGPWNDDKMATELQHKNSYCIIMRNATNNELIGYISFRIELQIENVSEEYLECYVYELMIADKYQRKGYGKLLMDICEFIANSTVCDYIELTVFTANIAAMKFYRKALNFNYDKNEIDQYKNDYRILTKIL